MSARLDFDRDLQAAIDKLDAQRASFSIAKVEPTPELTWDADTSSTLGVGSLASGFLNAGNSAWDLQSTFGPTSFNSVLTIGIEHVDDPDPTTPIDRQEGDSEEPQNCGSGLHRRGTCTPCKFFRGRRGCKDGLDCKLCHYPHLELTHSGIRQQLKKAAIEKRRFLQSEPAKDHEAGKGGPKFQVQLIQPASACKPGHRGGGGDNSVRGGGFQRARCKPTHGMQMLFMEAEVDDGSLRASADGGHGAGRSSTGQPGSFQNGSFPNCGGSSSSGLGSNLWSGKGGAGYPSAGPSFQLGGGSFPAGPAGPADVGGGCPNGAGAGAGGLGLGPAGGGSFQSGKGSFQSGADFQPAGGSFAGCAGCGRASGFNGACACGGAPRFSRFRAAGGGGGSFCAECGGGFHGDAGAGGSGKGHPSSHDAGGGIHIGGKGYPTAGGSVGFGSSSCSFHAGSGDGGFHAAGGSFPAAGGGSFQSGGGSFHASDGNGSFQAVGVHAVGSGNFQPAGGGFHAAGGGSFQSGGGSFHASPSGHLQAAEGGFHRGKGGAAGFRADGGGFKPGGISGSPQAAGSGFSVGCGGVYAGGRGLLRGAAQQPTGIEEQPIASGPRRFVDLQAPMPSVVSNAANCLADGRTAQVYSF